MNKKIVVITHKNCPDGFTAAWVSWTKFKNKADYIGEYPGQKIATDLKNPDFVKLCKAMGADAYRVTVFEDFFLFFSKALNSKKVNVIEIPISINQLSHRYSLK